MEKISQDQNKDIEEVSEILKEENAKPKDKCELLEELIKILKNKKNAL